LFPFLNIGFIIENLSLTDGIAAQGHLDTWRYTNPWLIEKHGTKYWCLLPISTNIKYLSGTAGEQSERKSDSLAHRSSPSQTVVT